jgi:tetratricopeptide (TPR) repeat protein
MSEATCSQCGKKLSIRSLFDLNGVTYCEPCVLTASREAKERRLPSIYVPLITKSICARCNTFLGDSPDSVQIGNLRFCAKCGPLIKDWDYPQWLKVSLAALLLLLVVALVHGRNYFRAGREMYVGERLVKAGKYAEAVPHLQETIRIAPGSDKGVLLLAKAALLSGDVADADKALQGHNSGYFEDASKPEFREVDSLWKRATGALAKAAQAQKLADQDGKEIEASRVMHEAATMYPELPDLSFAAESLDEGVAFVRKDYDAFLAIAEKQWKERPMAQTAAAMASALACKFAVTGEDSFRQRSQEMLEKARQLAQGDTKSLKILDEFAERNRYRLETRQIISKTEYDRRFRSVKTTNK